MTDNNPPPIAAEPRKPENPENALQNTGEPAPAPETPSAGWSLFGKKKGLATTAVTPAPTTATSESRATPFGQRKKTLSSAFASLNTMGMGKEKTRFIENLAILLNSGLTVVDALKTIELEVRSKPMKKTLK